MFQSRYGNAFDCNEMWNKIPVNEGDLYAWDESSSYIQEPPFLAELTTEVRPIQPICNARVLAVLGDSVKQYVALPTWWRRSVYSSLDHHQQILIDQLHNPHYILDYHQYSILDHHQQILTDQVHNHHYIHLDHHQQIIIDQDNNHH